MLRIDWKYKVRENDRILLMLPPLYTDSKNFVHTCFASRFRKTITHLLGNEKVSYIVVYIPTLNTKSFHNIDLVESIYGVEVRLLPHLQYLDRDDFKEHISNECIYLLEYPELLESKSLHLDNYFDTCIREQVYEYYDNISQKLFSDSGYYKGDIVRSSNYAMESFHAVMTVGKKIIPENIIHMANSRMHVEGDIVLVIGKIQDAEVDPLYWTVHCLARSCRLTGIYRYGDTSKKIDFIDETYPEVTFRAYPSKTMDKEGIEILWKMLAKHPSRCNTYLFIGEFDLDNDCKSEWEKLEKEHQQHTVYTPVSWLSLHNSLWKEETPGIMSLECIGLLHYLALSIIESSEEYTENHDDNYSDEYDGDDGDGDDGDGDDGDGDDDGDGENYNDIDPEDDDECQYDMSNFIMIDYHKNKDDNVNNNDNKSDDNDDYDNSGGGTSLRFASSSC